MSKWAIGEYDPAIDGHPCEVALAFRLAVVRSGLAEEVPADVLDLAIHFAWIGKAISRTQQINDWFISGIDPNTRDIISALSTDSTARQTSLTHSLKGTPATGMEKSLRHIRKSKGFLSAVETMRSICTIPSAFELRRLSTLCGLSLDLGDVRRLRNAKNEGTIVSIAAFKRLRELAK